MKYQFPDSRILLFAKAPIAGEVKTRLHPALGAEGCCELHGQLLEFSLAMLQQAAIAPVILVTAGEHECWQRYQHQFHVELRPQIEGDLGARMKAAASDALGECESVVLMGSDCPFITRDYLGSAFRFLRQGVGVVFGPADDGGYVLLGLTRVPPQLFTGIDWGTERVLQQSCSSIGGAYICLPSLPDIDRPGDIHALAGLEVFKRWLCYAP